MLTGPLISFGAEEKMSDGITDFDLVIKDNLISLNAKDVSLKRIIEEIGRRMNIEVDARITDDEKVSEQFDRLTLEDTLKRLSSNYAYLIDSQKEQGRIKRIVLLSRGKGKVSPPVQTQSAPGRRTTVEKSESRPEPFKFTFDPAKYLDKGK